MLPSKASSFGTVVTRKWSCVFLINHHFCWLHTWTILKRSCSCKHISQRDKKNHNELPVYRDVIVYYCRWSPQPIREWEKDRGRKRNSDHLYKWLFHVWFCPVTLSDLCSISSEVSSGDWSYLIFCQWPKWNEKMLCPLYSQLNKSKAHSPVWKCKYAKV